MNRRLPCLVVVLALAGLLPAQGFAEPRTDPTYSAIQQIAQGPTSSGEEKLAKLAGYLEQRPTAALFAMEQVQKGSGAAQAMAVFRDRDTGRELKLQLGHELVARLNVAEFEREFAGYLATAAADGGLEEFMQANDGMKITAIGELAYSAGGFEGVPASIFRIVSESMPADRLTAILGRALGAPDSVFPDDQGCIRMGEPGQPSGRNVPRQLLPIALAKVNATALVPRLIEIAESHKDVYLRGNAIYAVARMGSASDVREIEKWALGHEKQVPQGVFELGKGFVGRGDDRGVKYLLIKRDRVHQEGDIYTALYALEQRLDVVEGAPVRDVKDLYAEALQYKPLRALWLFDGREIGFERANQLMGGRYKDAEALLATQRDRILKDYGRIVDEIRKRGMKELEPEIQNIAQKTREAGIRDLSRAQ